MGGVQDSSQTSSHGVLEVACAVSRTPSAPYTPRGALFSMLMPLLGFPVGVVGPVGPGGR